MSGTETKRRVEKATSFYNESLKDHEDRAIKSGCKSLKDGNQCTNKIITL